MRGYCLHQQIATADLTVSYINVERQASFASERLYAGKTLASRSSELGFKRGGEIAQVLVDIGDVVQKDQVLARLDSRTLASNLNQAEANTALAQANLSAAKAEAQLAAKTEQRFRTLLEQGNTSKQIYDEAQLSCPNQASTRAGCSSQCKARVSGGQRGQNRTG